MLNVELFSLTMRGQRPPPDPRTLSPEQLRYEIALRESRVRPHARWCDAPLAGLISGVVMRVCERRGARCLELVVARSCTFFILATTYFVSTHGMTDAIRLVTTRRARRSLGWPKNMSVFSPHARYWPVPPEERDRRLLDRLPELARL
jgi:hypothetical protein